MMDIELVDSIGLLTALLDRLKNCKGGTPSLYVDLEGDNL